MDKQEVIEKLRNDEITLYTDILISELLEDILKSAFPEDLFDLKYLKINEYYHNDGAGWDYSGYNAKNLPIINLSDIEMKKYTLEDCINNKIAIHVHTEEELNVLRVKSKYNIHHVNFSGFNDGIEVFFQKDRTFSWNDYVDGFYFIKEGTWDRRYATKCIDFSELKLQNEMEEIIGYKLIAPEYKEAALSICNTVANWENSLKEYDIKINQTGYINKLKKAGVFDKWFEPVYAPQYKIGDYVIWKKETSQQHVYKISNITKDGYDLEWEGKNVFYSKDDIPFRKATGKEISDRLRKTLILGSTKIEIIISKDSIKADGKEWKIQTIKDFRNIMFPDRNIKDYKIEFPSIRIGCCTFTLNEIQTIIDTYLDLNGSN